MSQPKNNQNHGLITLTAGDLKLIPHEQQVNLAGQPVALAGRAFRLLFELMQRPQHLLSKQHLIDIVWEGRPVSDSVLTTAMKEVRKALDDAARSPTYIETVHGQGYRFLLPVDLQVIAKTEQQSNTPALDFIASTPSGPLLAKLSTPVLAVIGVSLLTVTLLVGFFLGTRQQQPSQTANTVAANSDFIPPANTIAVLPFLDLSPQANQAYFSDGIAEELLNVLTRINGLQVTSRTSSFAYKDANVKDLPQIARALNVRHILEGSVRKAGDTVRITAQLIDSQNDAHVWSGTYDRMLTVDSLFAIQDDISNAILTELLSELTIDAQRNVSLVADTQNIEAYDAYLQANALFYARGVDNIHRSIILFERAVTLDAEFARAWAGLAAASAVAPAWGLHDRDYPQLVRTAAKQATTLNPELALAYAAEGYVEASRIEPDFEIAMSLLDTAIEKDPNDPSAYLWRAVTLRTLGYFERALADLEACTQVDPAYMNCRAHMEWMYFEAGEPDKAVAIWLSNSAQGSRRSSVPLLDYYARSGQHDELLNVLNTYIYDRPFGEEWMVEALFKAFTDPEYDQQTGFTELLAHLDESGIQPLDDPNLMWRIWIAFDAYEHMQQLGRLSFVWGTSIPDYAASPHRKRMLDELNLLAYWQQHGFPKHCRAVGTTDFECQ